MKDGHRPGHAPDLSECAREPIRTPGSIQPHGVLLVLSERDLTVRQVSENSAELLGRQAADLLGHPLARSLGPDAADRLATDLEHTPLFLGGNAVPLGVVSVATAVGPGTFQAAAHRAAGGIVLELETCAAEDDSCDPRRLAGTFRTRAESVGSIADLGRLLCEEVRRVTGFDRTLLYRFDENWHGTVIGEDGSGRLPSYLHHRFPASDIPAQARELYRVNRVRIIPDARYRPVPIVPATNPAAGDPLDLSFSILRSVSPVHVEYMRNMGTAASMSISVLRDGRLWGLVSCHHADPKSVPLLLREACDSIAQSFSAQATVLERARVDERRREMQAASSRLVAAVTGPRGLSSLAEHPRDLLALTAARGAAVLDDEKCLLVGTTPAEHEVRQLADWLFRTIRLDVYGTDSLAGVYPPAGSYAGTASGLLAVAADQSRPHYVMWFRPEVIEVVTWAGDPHKPTATVGGRAKLHPRRSFETWKETVRARSYPWAVVDREEAKRFGEAVLRNAS